MKRYLLLAIFFGIGSCYLGASPILPTSYDMQNGETGSFTYFDDSYNGTGNTSSSLASLSGGLGDLTDGFVATQNWFNTPGPYVGWHSINPVITFHFAEEVTINQLTLFVDDSNGTGGVLTPASASITMGGVNQSFSINDPSGDAPLAVTFSNLNISGNSLDLQVNAQSSSSWVFISEITFDGATSSAVPEPASLVLVALGLGVCYLKRNPFSLSR